MSLLERIRKSVRVTASQVADAEGREPDEEGYVPTYSSPFDDELLMLIGAAERDMLRVGICPRLVHPEVGEVGADIEQCITLYVKCNFGYDNSEAPRFGEAYRMAVIDLMNSPANSAVCHSPHIRPCAISHRHHESVEQPADPEGPAEPEEPTSPDEPDPDDPENPEKPPLPDEPNPGDGEEPEGGDEGDQVE